MAHRVHYRTLANHLQTLSLSATCADLAASLHDYLAYDPDYQARIVAAIRELPGDAYWLDGLPRLCAFLKAENPRFIETMFAEWATEEI